MSGTEPGIAEIVAEVLAEHELELAYGVDVDGCSCGAFWLTTDDAWRQHVAQVVAERLQAAEVGACGAAVGEAGGSVVRTRCDEDSGSYGTCGCPIRCNLDAGHDGEHRPSRHPDPSAETVRRVESLRRWIEDHQ